MNRNWKKDIVLFLSSQTISLFGSSLVQYAIMWYVTMNTQSGVMMTVYIICGFLPTFFLSPFAGVWADRYDRKKLIIVADSAIALATLILAIVFMSGYREMWLLFVVAAIRALGAGVQTPAVGAFLPQIVPEDKLTKANAANGSIQSIIMLVSPMISGALLTKTSIVTIFFIDIVTAFIGISILVIFLRVEAHKKALENSNLSYFEDMQKGINYIRGHHYVRNFFIFCAAFFFLFTPAAFLTPLQVTRAFGNDVWRLTAIEITFSTGMILGGIIMASWGGFKNRVYSMAFSSFISAFCIIALGIVPNFYIYLTFMGFIGIAMPIFNTPSTVLLQEKVEPDYLGRVFGVFGMISSSMMPLGMLVFGPIADMIRIEYLLIGTGSLLFVLSFFLIKNKSLVSNGV
ncbi:MFS transporter [Clostridium intestinale]|uniref:MFS transporter, DHA3 family, macrolide efflux protein n=1 Tax=Clostridium intestinale DSM 6191 TaxID=1121320 RepID=A0A1M5WGY1_9CLOT|nr:MFS transporter [Clostridium intestinale]SHH86707.1 MFS transporter, DHA3 family, macrolide efflux protein [Clostridium intestinale DSM 6191]